MPVVFGVGREEVVDRGELCAVVLVLERVLDGVPFCMVLLGLNRGECDNCSRGVREAIFFGWVGLLG